MWKDRQDNSESYNIQLSIDGSTVRTRIILFLEKIGEATAYDISNGTEICYSNVYGALNGSRGRWSKKKSLINMGLVKERPVTRKIKTYTLTKNGHDIAISLKIYGLR